MAQNGNSVIESPFIRLPVQNPVRLCLSRHGRPYFIPVGPRFHILNEAAPYEMVAYVRECWIGEDGSLNCDPPGCDVTFQIEARLTGESYMPVQFKPESFTQ